MKYFSSKKNHEKATFLKMGKTFWSPHPQTKNRLVYYVNKRPNLEKNRRVTLQITKWEYDF